MKKEDDKKRVPLSLEELIAKKKAEEEAESKVPLHACIIFLLKVRGLLESVFTSQKVH